MPNEIGVSLGPPDHERKVEEFGYIYLDTHRLIIAFTHKKCTILEYIPYATEHGSNSKR